MTRQFTIGGVTFDLKLTLVIIFTTFVPMLDHYDYTLFNVKAYDRFVLYFLMPVIIIRYFFRESTREYGLRLGNWKEGMVWVAIVALVMGVVIAYFARLPEVQSYYGLRAPDSIGVTVFRSGVDIFAWEFIWRGFLLFVYARILGPGPAIFLQAVPFAFMHLGKPEIETLTTIFGGAGFGFVAWRTRSMLYGWLIHWFMVAFTLLLAGGLVG